VTNRVRGMETQTEFATLFRAEYASVARTAALILGDPEKGRDIAQEAFTRLFLSWKKVSQYERPGAWLRRVAIHLAGKEAKKIDLLRVAVRKLNPAESPPQTDPDVHDALRRLPHSQRAAVVLHYFEGMPVKEIAELLGCAEATAKVHLHRARKRLAEILGEEAADDDAR